MSQTGRRKSVPPPVVALVTWLVPGSGYWLLGQRARALTVGVTIIVLFVLGLLIGGVRVVDPPESYSGNPMRIVFDKPWFVGQILAGPMALATAAVTENSKGPNPWCVLYSSHSRSNEIGTLYTAVAGMLNLLAIINATHRAGQKEEAR